MSNDYFKRAKKLIDRAYSQSLLSYLTNDMLKKDYLTFCANLYNFLPHLSEKDYPDFYRHVLLNQSLAGLEQEYPELIYDMKIEGDPKSQYKSTIFCTFHFASYRLVNLYLTQQNVDFDLVIAGKPLEEQGDVFYEINRKAKLTYGTTAKFRILNAETMSGIIEAIKSLKSGGNLLFYIDGNTGLGTNSDNPNLIEIDFLQSTLLSRVGIAFLARHTNSNILPIIASRKTSYEHQIMLYEPIKPDMAIKKEDDLQKMTQLLFDVFKKHMNGIYEHWECWLYLERFLPENRSVSVSNKPSDGSLKYNKKRFSVESFENIYVLFDREQYSSIPISENFYNSFLNNNLDISADIITKLIDRGVLIN